MLVQFHAGYAEQSIARRQDVKLTVGDSLIVHSDENSIQNVFLQGNLSLANLTKPAQYPANDFEITSSNPGSYEVRLLFDYSADYRVNVFVRRLNETAAINSTSYYLSGGSFELNINATFTTTTRKAPLVVASLSPWASFGNWMSKFGQAFPLWVKLLYLVFGLQFFAVGGVWVKREAARRESGAQRLDRGDLVYLLLDVAYKFLLVSFVAILAIMAGELLILFILRFMFLVSLDLLSLWDLFVAGFAAGAVVIVYLTRFTLEKGFDLKPVEDD